MTGEFKRNYIYLVVGASGSGKTTAVELLCKLHNSHLKEKWSQVKSYTTRPKRSEDEDNHIFVDDNEFNKLQDLCAFTEFNGYKYAATSKQVENSTFYVIDPAGIEYFKEHYSGKKPYKIIYLKCSTKARYIRMHKRGDTLFKIFGRLINDHKCFKNFENKSDFCLNVSHLDINQVVENINQYISDVEK